MINLTDALLTNCVVHKIGNKVLHQPIHLSQSELNLTEDLKEMLSGIFFRSFKTISRSFSFTHEIDVKMNEVFACSDRIFEEEDLLKNSHHIAKHLFNQTRNPAIKPGELMIAFFQDILFENKICTGIGIVKSENKESFLKVYEAGRNITLTKDVGISGQRIDKGCLILNLDYHKGFRVFTYEHGGADTDYWRNDFLGIESAEDNINYTAAFIDLIKDYSTSHIQEDFGKQEQVAFMDSSLKYLSKSDNFSLNKFEQEIFSDADQRKNFKKFKVEYLKNNDFLLEESFGVSKYIVAQQRKKIRNEIKLDTNISIRFEGQNFEHSEQFIERGYDNKKRMNYYKIFYNNER